MFKFVFTVVRVRVLRGINNVAPAVDEACAIYGTSQSNSSSRCKSDSYENVLLIEFLNCI